MTPAALATAANRCRLAALAALVALGVGCAGETEIVLRADRESISAGGIDFAAVTATAYLMGDPVAAGTSIEFATSGGSFDASSEVTTFTGAADGGGSAQVKLHSGPTAGSATVTASFSDSATGQYADASITIKFIPASGSKTPVDGTFRLTCDAVNIGALREPVPDLLVTCNLAAQTRKGETIPASALAPTFMTEAGSITPKQDEYTGAQIFVYSPKGGASAPRDLPPEPALNEPTYTDANGKIRNPRDGLATLVAVVDGEEAFTDSNGNGSYDQGEPFEDAAEPFVDVDDDDEWDSDEKYLDVDNNGKWDRANGKWDASTKIAAIYKILWTGRLDNSPKTSRIDRTGSSITGGGKLDLTAYVLDVNMNPLAGFQENQDYLEWYLSSNGDATSSDSTMPPLSNALGFSFDKAASTERKRWKILANSFTPRAFKFTVEDGYTSETDPPTTFTVTATAYSTPGKGADGYFLPQVTEPITDKVEGTCD